MNINAAQPLVFVHFPKSGGTSLRHQIQDALGNELLLDYTHGPFGPAAHSTVNELPKGSIAVFGHFRPHHYDAVPGAIRCTIYDIQ